jgi:hypothetical protein
VLEKTHASINALSTPLNHYPISSTSLWNNQGLLLNEQIKTKQNKKEKEINKERKIAPCIVIVGFILDICSNFGVVVESKLEKKLSHKILLIT